MICCAREAIVCCFEVKDGDGTGGGCQELGDDVVAEETATADDEDRCGKLRRGGGGHCCKSLVGSNKSN